MGKKDARIDAYIANAAAFARPVLKHLRSIVHAGCPDVVETLKWSHPAFEHHGVMCGMSAFTEHCVFGFWKAPLLGIGDMAPQSQFGKITTLDDLPSESKLIAIVRKAAKLNEDGTAVARAPAAPKAPIPVPADLSKALAKNPKAKAVFAAFPPSQRREYLEWIVGAKAEATRQRRLVTAIEWMAEGKRRNWKYES
jgi:uncharacterized protein YdeI (YjbR/CyaY-like superfamily)